MMSGRRLGVRKPHPAVLRSWPPRGSSPWRRGEIMLLSVMSCSADISGAHQAACAPDEGRIANGLGAAITTGHFLGISRWQRAYARTMVANRAEFRRPPPRRWAKDRIGRGEGR